MQDESGKVTPLVIPLLLGFILVMGLALYFSAPDKIKNEQSQIANSVVDNQSDPHDAFIAKVTDTIPVKPKSFFTRIISNKNKTKSQATDTTASAELSRKQEKYLKNTYQELYESPYSNNQDEHLPSISGRVLNPNGKPLSGIRIKAIKRDYYTTDNVNLASLPSISTSSNAAGFYAFKDLPDGIYLLKTENNKRYLPQSIEVNTGVKFADIVLTELQVLELSGKVVKATTGQPIANVSITPLVNGDRRAGLSNAKGEFTLEFSLGDSHSIPLRISKKGFRNVRHAVDVNDWEAHQSLVIEMQESSELGSLAGLLKGNGSDYLSGHLVHIYSPSLKVNYRTNSSNVGEFSFSGIEVADDYTLWVRPSSGYKDFNLEQLHVGMARTNLDIQLETLESGYELSGQVVDLNNRPVRNITLALRSVSARNHIIPITTDAFGSFLVRNLPAGEIVIESNSAPYYTLSGIAVGGENKSSHRDLVVDRGSEKLLGKVINEQGLPVAAPKVYITSSQYFGDMQTQSSRNTSADIDGAFIFTDLGAQQYTITVNAPGYKGTRVRYQLNGQGPLVVRLSKKTI